MKRLAVYCGSAVGADPAFADMARSLGGVMVERGIELVYGGGKLGLMGVIADSVLAAGGIAHGVIPRALVDKEVAHRGLTSLVTVETMHERKAAFTEMSDAFICAPSWMQSFSFYTAFTTLQMPLRRGMTSATSIRPFRLLNAKRLSPSEAIGAETFASPTLIH